jgi:putative glutamine amidotransferase
MRCVRAAGGTPTLLAPGESDHAPLASEHAELCDAFVFTGGCDPDTSKFGEPTHPSAKVEHPDRQAYETALLAHLAEHAPDKPVLGVCLGMQMMALVAGGSLDQHMPDTTPTHAEHMDDNAHPITLCAPHSVLAAGTVTSWHRQSVDNPGTLRVAARAHDGVIEAIDDPARRLYLGVQWHPERTAADAMGQAVFDALVRAANA